MNHTGYVRGIAVGVIAGAAVGMIVTTKNKGAKKTVGRVLKAAGSVADNISGLWG